MEIYHYTNLNALSSILEFKELWMTRVDFLNDSSEYDYFTEVFDATLSEFYETHTLVEPIMTWFKRTIAMFRDIREEHKAKTFVISFALNGDSIPMWNYYSDKLGVAIGFDKSILEEWISYYDDPNIGGYVSISGEIIYSLDEQKRRIADVFESCLSSIITANSQRLDTAEDVTEIFADLWSDSVLFKDNKFNYEQEYRLGLVYLDDLNADLKFNVTGTNIKPYVKKPIDNNYINIFKSITISPLNQSELIQHGLHEMLKSYGIEISEDEISHSRCTLRNI